MKITKTTLILFTGMLLLITACSSTKYSLREPHRYNNDFDEVLNQLNDILIKERIGVINAEFEGDDTYVLHFFKKSAFIDERNFEYGATATMTIKRLGTGKTSIEIEEEKPDALVKPDYQEQLAKNMFKALNKVFELEPKAVKM